MKDKLQTAWADRAYILIGNGNLGRVFAQELSTHIELLHLSRQLITNTVELKSKIQAHLHPEKTDVFVLTAVSDPAIESVSSAILRAVEDLQISTRVHFINFSASKKVKIPDSTIDVSSNGFHPLYSFNGREISAAEWQTVPFMYDKNNTVIFEQAFPFWKNPTFALSQERGPLYHAMAVTGGNMPFTLISEAASAMKQQFNLPKEAITPFLHSLLRNFESTDGPVATGPLGRKDGEAVKEHIQALEESPILQDLYKKMIEKYWPEFSKEFQA